MMQNNKNLHNCNEHLIRGNCQICGKHHHAFVENGGGFGSGLVIKWCYYCHEYSAYYDDTGSDVNLATTPDFNSLSISYHKCSDFIDTDGSCSVCHKSFPEKMAEAEKSYLEPLYSACKRGDKYYLTGVVDRKTAESYDNPIRHLTAIIVPFVANGDKKGFWIVHDRTSKQYAKNSASCKSPSYNFFGGHVVADITKEELINTEIPQYIFDEAAKRELSEEFLVRDDNGILLEVWEGKIKTDKTITDRKSTRLNSSH